MSAGMALSTPSLTGSIMSAVPLGKAGVGLGHERHHAGARRCPRCGRARQPRGVAVRHQDRRRARRSAGRGALRRPTRASPAPSRWRSRSAASGARRSPRAAKDAYVSGMNVATLVGAVVAAIGAVIVYRKLPSTRVAPAMQPALRDRRRPRAAARPRRPEPESRSRGPPSKSTEPGPRSPPPGPCNPGDRARWARRYPRASMIDVRRLRSDPAGVRAAMARRGAARTARPARRRPRARS